MREHYYGQYSPIFPGVDAPVPVVTAVVVLVAVVMVEALSVVTDVDVCCSLADDTLAATNC